MPLLPEALTNILFRGRLTQQVSQEPATQGDEASEDLTRRGRPFIMQPYMRENEDGEIVSDPPDGVTY